MKIPNYLSHGDVLIQQRHVVVHTLENGRASVAVVLHNQDHALPGLGHLVQRGLNAKLLAGLLRDLLHISHALQQAQIHEGLQGQLGFVGGEFHPGLGGQLIPMAFAHTAVAQTHDEWNLGAELIDFVAHLCRDDVALREAIALESLRRLVEIAQ